MIIQSALLRKESSGLHFTIDYPDPEDTTQHHRIQLFRIESSDQLHLSADK